MKNNLLPNIVNFLFFFLAFYTCYLSLDRITQILVLNREILNNNFNQLHRNYDVQREILATLKTEIERVERRRH